MQILSTKEGGVRWCWEYQKPKGPARQNNFVHGLPTPFVGLPKVLGPPNFGADVNKSSHTKFVSGPPNVGRGVTKFSPQKAPKLLAWRQKYPWWKGRGLRCVTANWKPTLSLKTNLCWKRHPFMLFYEEEPSILCERWAATIWAIGIGTICDRSWPSFDQEWGTMLQTSRKWEGGG